MNRFSTSRYVPIVVALAFTAAIGVFTIGGWFVSGWAFLKFDEEWHLLQARILASGELRVLRHSDVLRVGLIVDAQAKGGFKEIDIQRQVRRIIREQCGGVDEPMLAMLPGYHCLLAVAIAIARALRVSNGSFLQDAVIAVITNGIAAVGLLRLLYVLAMRIDAGVGADRSAPRTASISWTAAILLPFHWLIYTDVLSTLLVVGIVQAQYARRPKLAAILGLVAMAVRQSNVVMVVAAPVLAIAQSNSPQYGIYEKWNMLRAELWRQWATLIPAAAFAGFVVLNGRMSVGPDEAHQAAFSISALIFSIAIFGASIAPLALWSTWRVVRQGSQAKRLATVTSCVVAAALSAACFGASHHWNRVEEMPWLLRNHPIAWVEHPLSEGNLTARIGLAVLLCCSFMAIHTNTLASGFALFLAVAWPLSVMPFALMEPRYSIAPIVIWLAVRSPAPVWVERAQLAWGMAVGGVLAVVHVTTGMFL